MNPASPDLRETCAALRDLHRELDALLEVVGDHLAPELDQFYEAYERARSVITRARQAGLIDNAEHDLERACSPMEI